MNVRLVKRDEQRAEERIEEKREQPSSETKVKMAVQSWIKEFQARKAEPARIFPPAIDINDIAS